MRVKRIIDDNIILNSPIKPFTQFNAAIQTKIIVNLVITGTIVQVYIPSSITTQTIMADNDRFDHVCQNQRRLFIRYLRHYIIIRMPETVTPPGVDSSMITCFLHGIKNVIVFDNMSSPCAFADINSGTGSIVNTVMTYRYVAAHGKLHSGNLLFKQTDCTYQVIRDLAISRMIVILRPFRIIHFIQRNKFPIPKTRRTYSRHIPDEANGTGSDRSQIRTGHCRIAIIFIKKDTIPSYVMDITITQSTFFRSPENNGSSPIYCPVRAEQRLILFHKGPYRLCQLNSLNRYVLHRLG